jgi:hypothetical protein
MPTGSLPLAADSLLLWSETSDPEDQLLRLPATPNHQLAQAFDTFSNHLTGIEQMFRVKVSLNPVQEALLLFVQSIQQHHGHDNEVRLLA